MIVIQRISAESKTKTAYNLRYESSKIVHNVLHLKKPFGSILRESFVKIEPKDRFLLQKLCFGVIRRLSQLNWIVNHLVIHPLPKNQRTIHCLILVGLYQIIRTRIPHHAILYETVEGVNLFGEPKFKKFINGVLRRFIRNKHTILSNENFLRKNHLHPTWMYDKIRLSWPKHYRSIIASNNHLPPTWLRVNRRKTNVASYASLLKKQSIPFSFHRQVPFAIKLDPFHKISNPPEFENGLVSIQDLSSQRCVLLLDPKNGEKILDVCSAPGVKTTHILEIAPLSRVTAVDANFNRIEKMRENFRRLGIKAKIVHEDGRKIHKRFDPEEFDRILLDVPCTSTGIIRRHPEIKWILKEKKIQRITDTQHRLLSASWKLLKTGGILLYSTCSIFPEENERQISKFLTNHSNACLYESKHNLHHGLQYFPEITQGDGFFFSKIKKIKPNRAQ